MPQFPFAAKHINIWENLIFLPKCATCSELPSNKSSKYGMKDPWLFNETGLLLELRADVISFSRFCSFTALLISSGHLFTLKFFNLNIWCATIEEEIRIEQKHSYFSNIFPFGISDRSKFDHFSVRMYEIKPQIMPQHVMDLTRISIVFKFLI